MLYIKSLCYVSPRFFPSLRHFSFVVTQAKTRRIPAALLALLRWLILVSVAVVGVRMT